MDRPSAPGAGSPPPDNAADRYMARAFELAERGRGTVSPNPLVGCVLVRDGQVVGEGWHERPGGPHAEVMALAQAGGLAAGARAYVTLEPCNHTGRTGPCTHALLAAGVVSVEAAMADPNPVAQGGAAALRTAGVPVRIGRGEARARRQNAVFLHVLEHGRPQVTLKAATSLDGRIAAADGTSQWLTGTSARARVHALRAEVDAVVVGSGTVLADDPLLTARPPDRLRSQNGSPPVRQPLRVVLDARGRTPAGARVLDGAAPTLVVTTAQGGDRLTLPAPGAHAAAPQVAVVAPGAGGVGVDPAAVLGELLRRHVHSVLVEGGAAVAGSFWDAGLVDRLEVHLAPLVLGDRGRPLLTGGPTTLADAPRLVLDEVDRRGDDVVLSLSRRSEP